MHRTSTEKMKITSSSETCKTIYHNYSHLLFLKKSRWQGFEVSYKWFFLFWNKRCNLKISNLNKQRGSYQGKYQPVLSIFPCIFHSTAIKFSFQSSYHCLAVFLFLFQCSEVIFLVAFSNDILAFLSFLSFRFSVNSVFNFRTFKT